MADSWAVVSQEPHTDTAPAPPSPESAPQKQAGDWDVLHETPPAPVGQPSITDRLQTNPVVGAPLQTMLRAGQGLEQLIAHAAATASDLGGNYPNAVSDVLRAAADHVDQSIKTQNKDYEDAGARVDAASNNPRASYALRATGEIVGNAINPAGMAGNAIKAAPTIANAAIRGAVSGAATGASQPSLNDTVNYWLDKGEQIAAGAGVGGLTGAATGALTKSPQPIPPPTTAQLRANADYASFAQKPVTLTPEASAALSDEPGQEAIKHAMNEAKINQEPHLIAEFQSLLQNPGQGQSVTTEAADKIRQSFDTIASAAGRDSPNAARGWNARSDAMETAIQQTPEINDARNTWAQFRKSQIIDQAIKRATDAQGTPAGFGDEAQALRKSFLQLARSKQFQSFTPDEQKAITDVANGTLSSNTLQRLGKFSPIKGSLVGLFELGAGALGAHEGGSAGGALPAVGLAAAGELARQGSNYATAKAAQEASELVRRGGPASPAPGPTPKGLIWNPLPAVASGAVNSLINPAPK